LLYICNIQFAVVEVDGFGLSPGEEVEDGYGT
jgi:hypothetical protein